MSAGTAGGPAEACSSTGSNRHTINTFFSPFDQTADLCGMKYASPMVILGAYALVDTAIAEECGRYKQLLSDFI